LKETATTSAEEVRIQKMPYAPKPEQRITDALKWYSFNCIPKMTRHQNILSLYSEAWAMCVWVDRVKAALCVQTRAALVWVDRIFWNSM
jgi:hypothetical protein